MEFTTAHLITIYPAGDYGWDVVVTDKNGNGEDGSEWFERKADAIREGRKRFNAEPTVRALIALNHEHWEIHVIESLVHRDGEALILANDRRVIRHR